MLSWVFILWFIIFLWISYRFAPSAWGKNTKLWSVGFFMLKTLGSIFIWYLYTFYYSDLSRADIYRFYYDGISLHGFAWNDPALFWKNIFGLGSDFEYQGAYFNHMANWVHPYGNPVYNDNRLVIRVHALIAFFTDKTMLTHSLWFAFLAWAGTLGLAKFASAFFSAPFFQTALHLFLIPGLALWVSAPLKETLLVVFAALIFAGFYFLDLNLKNWKGWVLLFLGAWLTALTKFYVAAMIVPGTALWLFWRKIARPAYFVPSLLAGLALVFLFDAFNPALDLLQIISFKQNNFLNLAIAENSGSLIQDEYLQNSAADFFRMLPIAWKNAFFEPLPQKLNLLSLPALGDNLWFWTCCFFALYKNPRCWLSTKGLYLIIIALIFFAVLGLTTPVLGALFRYKVPLWFIAAPVLLSFIYSNQLKGDFVK